MKKYYAIAVFLFFCIMGGSSCMKGKGDYQFDNKENIYAGATIDYFKSKEGIYDSLLLVLDRLPIYKEALVAGNITVFTPTNSSFELAIKNLNLVRTNQGRPKLSLSVLDVAQLDTLLSRYVIKDMVNTDAMFYVDGLFVETLRFEEQNKGLMHAQRIKQQASGFVDGGLVRVFYSDTKRSTFVNQWIRTGSQAVNIRADNGFIHILSSNHEFGFGEFLLRMNK